MSAQKIAQTLSAMSKIMPGGERIDGASADFLLNKLAAYDSEKVSSALDRCFKELKFFPQFSDILERIDDGRPGTEEAWALSPKDEGSAAYLNNEIMAAWDVASSLLGERGGEIAARMAFRETYERIVKSNRADGLLPTWHLSRASGPSSERKNEAALRTAVEKKRITEAKAVAYLPTYVATGTTSIGNDQKIRNLISGSMKGIE